MPPRTGYILNVADPVDRLLEICDVMASQDEVVARENHWKSALLSRGFGYNAN
jgi:hypothetical protein